jgi:hypothetical protein
MKTGIIIWCFHILVISFLTSLESTSKWPAIKQFEEKRFLYSAGIGNVDTPFSALIKDTGGMAVYRLECHNGNYEDQSVMNFSGDFQCALFSLKDGEISSSNLLAADTKNELNTDWWNRGRMRSVQLRGECLNFPEYSTTRHFKLRGMLVTLQFSDIQWSIHKDRQNNPLINRFAFVASAVPDPTALSSRAEKVHGPEPPKACYP